MKKQLVGLKTTTFPVLSLFLKWYLCRETLLKQRTIKTLLDEMDENEVVDEAVWMELLRRRLLLGGLRTVSSILERPLDQNEVVHLYERVEEFVQLYAMGLKT